MNMSFLYSEYIGYPLQVQYQILQRSMELYQTNIWDQSLTYGHFNLHNTRLWDHYFIPHTDQTKEHNRNRGHNHHINQNKVVDDDSIINDERQQIEAGKTMMIKEDEEVLVDDHMNSDNEKKLSFGQYCMDVLRMNVIAAAPLSMGLLVPTYQHLNIPTWHPASKELKQACYHASQLWENESLLLSNHQNNSPHDETSRKTSSITHDEDEDEVDKNYNNDEISLDISSIAILFAISHPHIPCTMIGMKNIDQIKTVQRLVDRMKDIIPLMTQQRNIRYNCNDDSNMTLAFHDDYDHKKRYDNDTTNHLTHETILQMILNEKEYEILCKIRDRVDGPFRMIWENNIDAWDGLEQVHQFWKKYHDIIRSQERSSSS
jgi:hypothetical protein